MIKEAKEVALRENQIKVARTTPHLDRVLRDHLNNTLDRDRYPYVIDPPHRDTTAKVAKSVRTHDMGLGLESAAIGFAQEGHGGMDILESCGPQFDGPRLIVFVAGGITWSEVKCLHRISKQMKREIVIASTHISTP